MAVFNNSLLAFNLFLRSDNPSAKAKQITKPKIDKMKNKMQLIVPGLMLIGAVAALADCNKNGLHGRISG